MNEHLKGTVKNPTNKIQLNQRIEAIKNTIKDFTENSIHNSRIEEFKSKNNSAEAGIRTWQKELKRLEAID